MRRTSIAALVVAGLLSTGCGGGDDQPAPSVTPTSSASSGTTDPTPTEPAVEPAAGFLIDLDRVRMRAPDGWKKNDPLSTFLRQAYDPETPSTVALSDLSAVSDTPLQRQAEIAADRGRSRTEIVDPVEIAGVEWYHVTGRDDRFTTFDKFGTIHNGSEAVIEFGFDDEIPEAEQQEIIDSVLATVEWK